MGFRHTVITGFLYLQPGEAGDLAEKMYSAFGAEPEHGPRSSYLALAFSTLSTNEAQEVFEAADLGVPFVMLTEWGEVWSKPGGEPIFVVPPLRESETA